MTQQTEATREVASQKRHWDPPDWRQNPKRPGRQRSRPEGTLPSVARQSDHTTCSTASCALLAPQTRSHLPVQRHLWITGRGAAEPVDNWPCLSKPEITKLVTDEQAAVAAGRCAISTMVSVSVVPKTSVQSSGTPLSQEATRIQFVQFLVVHIAITRNWPSRLSQESTPVGEIPCRTTPDMRDQCPSLELKDRCKCSSPVRITDRPGRTTPADPKTSRLSSRKWHIQ